MQTHPNKRSGSRNGKFRYVLVLVSSPYREGSGGCLRSPAGILGAVDSCQEE